MTEICTVIFAELITKVYSPRIKPLYVISKVEWYPDQKVWVWVPFSCLSYGAGSRSALP